jgi:hypothetical protein
MRALLKTSRLLSITGLLKATFDFRQLWTHNVESCNDTLDCPDLIACAPPGYHYNERARPQSAISAIGSRTNHGGVCLFCTRVGPTFHWLQYVWVRQRLYHWLSCDDLNHSCVSTWFTDLIFDDFSDLLERSSTYASSLIIAGDFNIHLEDDTSDSATVKVSSS